MHRKRNLVNILKVVGLVLTWGILLWLRTNGEQLVQTLQPTPTALEAHFDTIRLRQADFSVPDTWHAHEPYSEELFSASANMVYAYNHTAAFWIKVTQLLRIYPNTAAAQTAYNSAISEWFTAEWAIPTGLNFSGNADMLTVRCVAGYIENIHYYP